jgi:hypothetical protein
MEEKKDGDAKLFCIHNTCDPNSIFGSDFDDLAICVERKR